MEVESNPGLNAGALSPTPPSFSRLASFLTKHEQKNEEKKPSTTQDSAVSIKNSAM